MELRGRLHTQGGQGDQYNYANTSLKNQMLRTVKVVSSSRKHSKRKHFLVITPIVYSIFITSVTHVCVLNINITFFVTMETQPHPVNKALIISAYFALCGHEIAYYVI